MDNISVSFKAMFPSVIGVDVHKEENVACYYRPLGQDMYEKEIRRFSTLHSGIQELCRWAKQKNVAKVFMESTGVYWVTLSRALAEHGLDASVVNPYHIKNIPGRKTDTADSEWIAKVGSCGLVKSSFTPDSLMFRLRQLSKIHTKLVKERTSWKNSLNKVLVEAGLRLDIAATDAHGVSSRMMLEALMNGLGPEEALRRAGNRLKTPKNILRDALECNEDLVRDTAVNWHYKKVVEAEEQVSQISDELIAAASPIMEYVNRLMTIPGINEISAIKILSEIGSDMTKFGSPEKLSSWAGVCPGNNESAGKRKSGKTVKGNRRIRTILIECAHAAAKSKSALSDKFKILHFRRGYKKAIVAIAHKIVRIIYCIISRQEVYNDLTVNYTKEMVKKNAPRWIKQLSMFGLIALTSTSVKESVTSKEKKPKSEPKKPMVAKSCASAIDQPVAEKRPRGRPKGSGKKKN
jgi:transposase